MHSLISRLATVRVAEEEDQLTLKEETEAMAYIRLKESTAVSLDGAVDIAWIIVVEALVACFKEAGAAKYEQSDVRISGIELM